MTSVEAHTMTTPPAGQAIVRPRPRRRRWVWWLAGASIVGLLVKLTIVDVFAVREQSMWLALRGGVDHVLVDEISPRFALPPRFSICVFRHRDADQVERFYVKRLIALPGERVDFRDGDLFVGPEGAPPVRLERLADLVDAEFVPVYPPAEGDPADFFRATSGDVQVDAGRVTFTPPPGGRGTSLFVAGKGVDPMCIRDDHLGLDGRIVRGRTPVSDVRIDAAMIDPGAGRFSITHHLKAAENRRVEIGPDGIVISARVDGAPSERARFPNAAHRTGLRIETIDGLFRVSLPDGSGWRELYSEPRDTATFSGFSGVRFEVEGAPAVCERLVVLRDVHYVWGADREDGSWSVPWDRLFLVGDNVPVSIDSRDAGFGTIPTQDLVGIVRAVVWPFDRARRVR